MVGRPRSTKIDDAIAKAVRELLRKNGYAGTSLEQVARRAGVNRAAIYRRWGSKPEMVFALAVHPETISPPADSGSLAGDLDALAGRVVEIMTSPLARIALPGLLADSQGAELIDAAFIGAERRVLDEIVERAEARGELAVSPDVGAAHAVLLGTAFASVFLIGGPARGLPERVARATLPVLVEDDRS